MTSTSPADNNEFWFEARDRLKEAAALLSRVRRFSTYRLLVTASAALVAFGALEELFSAAWLLVPAAVFTALALVHDRVWRRAQAVHRIAEMHHRAALRVDADTEGEPDRPGTPAATIRRGGVPASRPSLDEERRLASRLHRIRDLGNSPWAEHLELFGAGQLFERLADWRTDAGGEVLARWMLRPAPPAEIRERQAAIRELGSRLDIREALAAADSLEEWPSERCSFLLDWLGTESKAPAGAAGAGPGGGEEEEGADGVDGAEGAKGDSTEGKAPWPALAPPRFEILISMAGGLLSLAILVEVIFWTSRGEVLLFPIPLLFALALGLLRRKEVRAHETVSRVLDPEIAGLREIAAALASEDYESPRLKELYRRLEAARRPLAGLQRLHSRLRLRRNFLFAPVAALVFWGTHHVWAINRWRRRHGNAMRRWLEAAGEFDALVALAQYAVERPGHVFPELDEIPGLEAVNLGHPLIPEARLQRNTVRLGRGDAEVLIVTGSNMSGKSTLLRAIGVNFVLARMGGPTAATTFRLGPLSLGASIAVHDSLRDGVSRFLAELLALRSVLETGSAEEPLLFLLDEVLQGTNSNDRRAAAGALLRELGRRSAVGVMTTHDLSLTELADELPDRVRNMHFTERVVDGAMEFDYQLRDGVLPHGNALDLMRILKLPVPGAESGDFTSLPPRGTGREH